MFKIKASMFNIKAATLQITILHDSRDRTFLGRSTTCVLDDSGFDMKGCADLGSYKEEEELSIGLVCNMRALGGGR